MYLIDPLTGEDKEKPSSLGQEFLKTPIVDAKLFETTLVFRNTQNQFYWVSNVMQHPPQVQSFEYVSALLNATISDYLIIPKGTKGSSSIELLVPDPVEGLWQISENKKAVQIKDAAGSSFGKVQYLALNAKKELLALYTEAESKGRIIVLKSSLNAEFNRFDTKLTDAKALDWCGNDAPVLTYPDRVVIVGPNEYESIDIRCTIVGIKSTNEIDGLRIVTTEKTYFLERVQPKMLSTFKVASISASAKLLQAQKSVDMN